jgi:hypothetical protein
VSIVLLEVGGKEDNVEGESVDVGLAVVAVVSVIG